MRTLALLLAAGAPAWCADRTLPLFVIERNLNANVVHYDAQTTADGKLDPRQPVIAYWVMAAEDGRRQELNFLEKMKAYGLTTHPDPAGDSYRIVLAAEKRKEIHVYRQGRAARAETIIAGHRAYLQKIFVSTHKSLGMHLPSYVELFGVDIATGQPCHERLLPDK